MNFINLHFAGDNIKKRQELKYCDVNIYDAIPKFKKAIYIGPKWEWVEMSKVHLGNQTGPDSRSK